MNLCYFFLPHNDDVRYLSGLSFPRPRDFNDQPSVNSYDVNKRRNPCKNVDRLLRESWLNNRRRRLENVTRRYSLTNFISYMHVKISRNSVRTRVPRVQLSFTFVRNLKRTQKSLINNNSNRPVLLFAIYYNREIIVIACNHNIVTSFNYYNTTARFL